MNTATAAPVITSTVVSPNPALYVPAQLPTCPDGSGDLWWDDASYAAYQSFDGGDYEPSDLELLTDSLRYHVGDAGYALELHTTNYCGWAASITCGFGDLAHPHPVAADPWAAGDPWF
jgi:hypothetical protein